PVTTPLYPQCHGSPTWCTVLSRNWKGRMRRVTSALARIEARGVEITTHSVLPTPISAACSGEISQNSSGCNSASQGSQRVIAPPTWCSVSRYVDRTCGYSGEPTGAYGLPGTRYTRATGLLCWRYTILRTG